MNCEKCGYPTTSQDGKPINCACPLVFCPDGAERSGVLQGCLPSTNCSAGAGADAQPNSLINSVVPRETAVEAHTWNIHYANEKGEAFHHQTIFQSEVRLIAKQALEAGMISLMVLRTMNPVRLDAPHCKGERALARNVEAERPEADV